MLNTSKFKLNDVVTIKLTSGEEVIGYFVRDDMSGITLRKPIVPVPTSSGSIGLAPYLMSSSYLQDGTEMTFSSHAVITRMETSKQFAEAFIQQVSGLDLAPSSPGLITN